MRIVAALVLALFLAAGCSSPPADDPSDAADEAIDRHGVVILEQDYTVTYPQQSGYEIEFTGKERNVVLEIRQDSGVLANMHVGIGPCGDADVPGSASWETYALCDRVDGPSTTEVTIDVRSGGPRATGRFLIRADMVA